MTSTPSEVRAERSSSSVFAGIRAHAWTLLVWPAMIGWATALFVVVREHHGNIEFRRYDLGNMVQAVWSTAQGRPLEVTDGVTGEQMARLGVHVDPILAALAPLWILAPTPLTLVAVQIVAVALGALPVLWLARRHLESERTAATLALAYLAYPWIAWSAVEAFHPVTLAIPLFLYCVWFLDTGRLAPFALCAVLAAATGEIMGLVVAALGVWYAVEHGRRRAGFIIAALGTGWTIVALGIIVPAFSGGSSRYYGAFEAVGGSPLGLVETAFTDPGTVVAAVTSGDDLRYLVALAGPLGGAFVLAPIAAVALIPLAVNLLSGTSAMTVPHMHYISGIVPFLFAATAIGLERLSVRRQFHAVFLILTLCVTATLAVGPWPEPLGSTPTWYSVVRSPQHVDALKAAIGLVPDTAPVSSTNDVGSHLAARRYFYSVPVVRRAEWIVLDSSDAFIPRQVGGYTDRPVLEAFHRLIERSPKWRKVFEQEGVFVYRRINA